MTAGILGSIERSIQVASRFGDGLYGFDRRSPQTQALPAPANERLGNAEKEFGLFNMLRK
jgi:hypothetical protein